MHLECAELIWALQQNVMNFFCLEADVEYN